ncbi:hypothetical protein SAV14893_080940 [Streptomyces avermitilis]|uniref:Uncharacterized protein n=1 Tax=Streptomyces avermitilis TaxID=33903 RepID=A0A4D4MFX6_STRAX|nr:hypothetical protein SAV14893_080940 [Streptomyces avermitilis]GDY70922.1 hypothetical protein SAV31267_004070 [Streptomyces avermitilis]
MSLPWATRGLKIPYVDRNDRQSRSLAMATAPSYSRSSRNLPRETTSYCHQNSGMGHAGLNGSVPKSVVTKRGDY